jgi:hypothetical protein
METKKDYDYYWSLLQNAPSGQKEEIANKCLELAQNIHQINDMLFCYSSTDANGEKEKYWTAYIRLAENVRQIRQAVKFCPPQLKSQAERCEAILWLRLGSLVPHVIPSLK